MKKINNKGFTLMEVLAVIVIITIIGLIAVPSVLSIINTGKNSSYDILVKDITIAAIGLHEEVSFTETNIYKYIDLGKDSSNNVSISESEDILKKEKYYNINVNLQTLVSNGFLTGTNNPDKTGSNKNEKKITNPKNGKDMGNCEITIIKIVNTDTFETSYEIISNSGDDFCPTAEEYNNALNIKEGE